MARRWQSVCVLVVAILLWLLIVSAIDLHLLYAAGFVASALALLAVVAGLNAELRRSEANAAQLMSAFVTACGEAERRELDFRARLHDARSTAAGMHATLAMLGRNTTRAPAETGRAGATLLAELARLQSLLESGCPEPLVDFDLAEALTPIVLTHRAAGSMISWDETTAITVRGRPHATASALDNLLCNARVHAPGAEVSIIAWAAEENAVVLVHDDGPGIPEADRERMLLPGARGATTAPGTGLGLHNAATAMADQHGALRLRQPTAGGTLVTLTLPLATSSVAGPAQISRLAG